MLLTRIAVFVLGSQNSVLPGLSVADFNRSCPPVEVRLEILVARRLLLGGQSVISAFLTKIGANLGGFRLVFQGVKFLVSVGSLESGSRCGFWRDDLFGFLFLGFGTAAARLLGFLTGFKRGNLGSHTLGIAFCAQLLRTVEVEVVFDGVSSRIENCFIETKVRRLC